MSDHSLEKVSKYFAFLETTVKYIFQGVYIIFQDEKTQLVVRVGELETEINKLRTESKKANTASKLAEERRQKLKELERQHAEHKKTLSELKKLQETRRRMEDALKKTEDELKNLKTQRLRLLKEQRAEASKFQAFKQKHEREMAQIKSKLQKREMDVARQKRIDEQKFAVLQQVFHVPTSDYNCSVSRDLPNRTVQTRLSASSI